MYVTDSVMSVILLKFYVCMVFYGGEVIYL